MGSPGVSAGARQYAQLLLEISGPLAQDVCEHHVDWILAHLSDVKVNQSTNPEAFLEACDVLAHLTGVLLASEKAGTVQADWVTDVLVDFLSELSYQLSFLPQPAGPADAAARRFMKVLAQASAPDDPATATRFDRLLVGVRYWTLERPTHLHVARSGAGAGQPLCLAAWALNRSDEQLQTDLSGIHYPRYLARRDLVMDTWVDFFKAMPLAQRQLLGTWLDSWAGPIEQLVNASYDVLAPQGKPALSCPENLIVALRGDQAVKPSWQYMLEDLPPADFPSAMHARTYLRELSRLARPLQSASPWEDTWAECYGGEPSQSWCRSTLDDLAQRLAHLARTVPEDWFGELRADLISASYEILFDPEPGYVGKRATLCGIDKLPASKAPALLFEQFSGQGATHLVASFLCSIDHKHRSERFWNDLVDRMPKGQYQDLVPHMLSWQSTATDLLEYAGKNYGWPDAILDSKATVRSRSRTGKNLAP